MYTKIMSMRVSLILFLAIFLIGCSTHQVRLEYTASHTSQPDEKGLPAIAMGTFSDERGDDARRDNGTWIGAIRGGYGNTLKTILVDQPVSELVANEFAQALKARGAVVDTRHNDAHLVLSGSVVTFACKQYVRRDCTVTLDVVLTDRESGQRAFQKKYEANEIDGSSWAMDTGIFGSVDKLRDLAAKTLNICVDKAMDDSEFVNAVSHRPLKTQSRQVADRLKELKALLDQGLISQEEYERKRSAVLQEL